VPKSLAAFKLAQAQSANQKQMETQNTPTPTSSPSSTTSEKGSVTDKLLVGILVGIVIWLVTNAVSFLLQRYRLEKALIEDIKYRRLNLEDTQGYLDVSFNNFIKEGTVLNYQAYFTKQEFPFYEDIRKDLFKYFGAQNLIAIMRCYEAFEEIEILMEGLIKDFSKWATEKQVLSADDVAFLKRKKERIIKIINILKRGELRGIKDVPRDYEGKESSVSIIRQ
jgi:hypothetical protein